MYKGKEDLLKNIRGFARRKGNAGSLFGETFKVGQYGNDVTLYNMEKSLEIQGSDVYPSLKSTKVRNAENHLTLLDMELAEALREGNEKDARKVQMKIERAKLKINEIQKIEEHRYLQTRNALDNILYLLFRPSSSPRYVPSKR